MPGGSKGEYVPGVTYLCVRCGTPVSGEELSKLPSPTCSNCGFRVFRKSRGPVPKNLRAE